MTAAAWFTLVVVAAVVLTLVRDRVPPAAAMTGGMIAVLAARVVDPHEALSGFSNPAPITIAALFVLARAVDRSGILQPIVSRLLGDGSHERRSLTRMVGPAAAASGILNNTPIVAMLVPQVQHWADTHGRSASRFLMPISFAAILGGTLTLMGTATNVVISGQMESSGLDPLGFFEITRIGLPIALVGLVVIVATAPRVLPSRRSPRSVAGEQFREFTVEMVVEEGGAVDGTSVGDAGLRHLKGVFLVSIERQGEQIAPIRPDDILRGGDHLRFAGKATEIVDLQATRGLQSAETEHMTSLDTSQPEVFEAVVGGTSPLVGKTLKSAGFRGRYQAAVIAVHRAGHRIDAKLGEVPLRVGDTLLLLADPSFAERWNERNDFLLISGGKQVRTGSSKQRKAVAAIALGIVVTAASGVAPLVTTALVGAAALVVFGILTPGQARDAVDLDVIVTIAAAFGVAAAVEASGLADSVASGLSGAFAWAGSRGVLLGVVLATVALTELVTNNAAALLMFPVAVSSAAAAGTDPRGAAIAVAVAASASFLTPIGYQTNTMVYGPGGYHFGDYARLGAPLSLAAVAAVVAFVPILWPS